MSVLTSIVDSLPTGAAIPQRHVYYLKDDAGDYEKYVAWEGNLYKLRTGVGSSSGLNPFYYRQDKAYTDNNDSGWSWGDSTEAEHNDFPFVINTSNAGEYLIKNSFLWGYGSTAQSAYYSTLNVTNPGANNSDDSNSGLINPVFGDDYFQFGISESTDAFAIDTMEFTFTSPPGDPAGSYASRPTVAESYSGQNAIDYLLFEVVSDSEGLLTPGTSMATEPDCAPTTKGTGANRVIVLTHNAQFIARPRTEQVVFFRNNGSHRAYVSRLRVTMKDGTIHDRSVDEADFSTGSTRRAGVYPAIVYGPEGIDNALIEPQDNSTSGAQRQQRSAILVHRHTFNVGDVVNPKLGLRGTATNINSILANLITLERINPS